jgi:hypothetical protein
MLVCWCYTPQHTHTQVASRLFDTTHCTRHCTDSRTDIATHRPKHAGTTYTAQHKWCQLILYLYAKKHSNTIPTNRAHAANLGFSFVLLRTTFFVPCHALDVTKSHLRKHSQETTDCQNKRFCSAKQSYRRNRHAILTVIAYEMLKQLFVILVTETPLHIYRETQNQRLLGRAIYHIGFTILAYL